MSVQNIVAAWRHQLSLSGYGSNSRRAKVDFLLAVEDGARNDLDPLIYQIGLFATPAKPVAEQTRSYLSSFGEDSPNLRRELGELVPADERPKTPEAPEATA